MKNFIINIDNFIEEYIIFFRLRDGEDLVSIDGTVHLSLLVEKIFICRFLYDCIDKGITIQRELLEGNSEELSRKVDPKEISKITENFREIIINKDLISILAYEFFINYLDSILREILHKNTKLLRDIKEVNYKSYELIERITKDPNIIIDELINILISGYRDEGNLRTRSEFWIGLLNKPIGINLNENCMDFWEAFNIRRNASSHRRAKERWDKVSKDLSNSDMLLWLYGILYLAYIIDNKLNTAYNIVTSRIEYNFSGDPIYSFSKVRL